MNVVDLLTPLKRTTVPTTKPAPLTARLKPWLPARTEVGDVVLTCGRTVRFTGAVVPPPGVGLTTVMGKRPEVVKSVERTVTVN